MNRNSMRLKTAWSSKSNVGLKLCVMRSAPADEGAHYWSFTWSHAPRKTPQTVYTDTDLSKAQRRRPPPLYNIHPEIVAFGSDSANFSETNAHIQPFYLLHVWALEIFLDHFPFQAKFVALTQVIVFFMMSNQIHDIPLQFMDETWMMSKRFFAKGFFRFFWIMSNPTLSNFFVFKINCNGK